MRRFLMTALACGLWAIGGPLAAEDGGTGTMEELAIFMTITTQPGQRDALVALWDTHLKGRAVGNDAQTRYVLALDVANPDVIHISEVYATKDAFEANAQAPWFADYMAEAGPLLAGEPAFHMTVPHWVK